MEPDGYTTKRRAALQCLIREWIGSSMNAGNPDETSYDMMQAAMLVWDAESRGGRAAISHARDEGVMMA